MRQLELIKIEITCSHSEHRSKALALNLVQEHFNFGGVLCLAIKE